MSTDATPASHARRTLRADQPAELLAAARLGFCTVPRDCVILLGYSEAGARPVLARLPLHELVTGSGRERIEHHFTLMRERGYEGAVALIVLEDGYTRVADAELDAYCSALAPMLLDAAAQMLPEPFSLYPLWVLGSGTAQEVRLQSIQDDHVDVRVSAASVLLPFDRTQAALDAVVEGQSIGSQGPARAVLRTLGADLVLRSAPAATESTAELFARTRNALSRLGAGPGAYRNEGGAFVTDCEQLSVMVSALAIDAVYWELLAVCVERGSGQPVDRELLLQELTRDPTRRPHGDVCAGGDWYEAIVLLRDAAAAAMDSSDLDSALVAQSAWRGVTTVLSLLAWWNHRSATAGELVDELARREPDSTLALLLAQLIDAPITPAWWPET